MRIIARRTASPPPTLKPRNSCIYYFVRQGDVYTHLRCRAGFAGAYVDREVETKGVSDLLERDYLEPTLDLI